MSDAHDSAAEREEGVKTKEKRAVVMTQSGISSAEADARVKGEGRAGQVGADKALH